MGPETNRLFWPLCQALEPPTFAQGPCHKWCRTVFFRGNARTTLYNGRTERAINGTDMARTRRHTLGSTLGRNDQEVADASEGQQGSLRRRCNRSRCQSHRRRSQEFHPQLSNTHRTRTSVHDWNVSDWSTTAARTEASRLRRLIDEGGDPLADIEAERAAPTVWDLCDRFEQEHLPRKRPGTADGYRGCCGCMCGRSSVLT